MSTNIALKRSIAAIKMKHSGITQAEIASKIGYRSTYLSDVINGKVPLSEKLTDALCNAYGISRAWMQSGGGEIFNNGLPGAASGPCQRCVEKERTLVTQERLVASLEAQIRLLQEHIEIIRSSKVV